MPTARHRRAALLRFAGWVIVALAVNCAAQRVFFRIDLTGDRRYTLTEASKRIVQRLEQRVLVQVYLDGEMPVELKQLRATIKETLDELKVYAGGRLHYEFINPGDAATPQAVEQTYRTLYERGLAPVHIAETAPDGSHRERTLFPGACIVYPAPDGDGGGEAREMAVNFLQSNAPDADSDQSLLLAQQNVETALVNAIARITQKQKPRIAFVEGHGELDEYETGDICMDVAAFAEIDRRALDGEVGALDDYALAVIARPTQPWSEADKIVVDQYLMRGGRVAWFIDAVEVYHDSLANGQNTFALACGHQLDDQLFKYGVRLPPAVVSDLQCAFLPVNIAPAGQTADFKPAPWTYYPLLAPPATHSITRGLNLIETKYPGAIDTVGRGASVARIVLLRTSENSRTQAVPLLISLAQSLRRPDAAEYRQASLPVAVLMEGTFASAFVHRPLQQYNHGRPFAFRSSSERTKMLVVADGDVIRNEVVRRPDGVRIFPLGFDPYMNMQFGNRAFVKNCIFYLLDDDNLLQVRRREWALRMLDKTKIYPHRDVWVALNSALPIALVLLAGLLFVALRRRKYARRRGM
jgi:ABC-2 type transport system permease protein